MHIACFGRVFEETPLGADPYAATRAVLEKRVDKHVTAARVGRNEQLFVPSGATVIPVSAVICANINVFIAVRDD